MPRSLPLMVLCLTAWSWTNLLTAADWPQFGGPNRDGISPETDFDPQALTTPKLAWTVDVGVGYSAPAIVGEAVYIMGHAGEQEHVRRLDAATGAVVWTHSYPGALIDNLNAGGPGATPSVDGEVVYTLGREGQLYCLKTADGAVVWSKMLPEAYSVKVPEWGFTASPLVLGDRVIVDAGRLVALNKLTGDELWQSNPYKIGYGTPTPFLLDGTDYLAHLNNDGLTIVKLDDGTEAAFVQLEAQFDTAAATPIIDGDKLFISVGYNGACGLYEFRGKSLKQVYQNKNLKAHFDTPVLVAGKLYGISGQSNNSRTCLLVCLDFATGKKLWEQRGGGFGALNAAGETLLYLNDTGRAAFIKADPTGFKLLSTGQVVEGTCWTAPVLANGRLYCRTAQGKLAVVDVAQP